MKSLQNKLNLIKEGKGNKELFLKEARAMFPNVVTGALTFDQAVHNLTERGILSEGFIGVSSKRPNNPDWFQIFNENVKAELKDTDKDVEKLETAGYDYKDEKNSNNLSMESILTGYYAEMKDPKNAEKTEEELKEMVVKNLTKDPLYYVKDGQFGVKELGYTDKHPGLGHTKEVTGKYKSSGMEPVRLNESKHSAEADLKIYKSELNMLNKIKPTGEKQLKRKAELEKKIADLESKMNEIESETALSPLPKEWYSKYYTVDFYMDGPRFFDNKTGDQVDYMDIVKHYEKETGNDVWDLMNEIGMLPDPVGYKKSEPNPKDLIFTKKFVGTSDTPGHSGYIYDIYKNGVKIKTIEGEGNANAYINQLKRDLEGGVEADLPPYDGDMNEALTEGYGMSLEDAMKQAYEESLSGYVQHVEDNGDGTFKVSDWYDSDMTVVSFEDGRKFNDRASEYMTAESKLSKLTEGANKAMEKAVKEIEKKSELAKAEAKVSQIDELISELESKLSMTEAEGVSEMVDKKKVKEIQRNIKFLEAKKKRYDTEKSRLEGKYGEKKKEVMGEELETPNEEAGEQVEKMGYAEAVKEMLKRKGLKK